MEHLDPRSSHTHGQIANSELLPQLDLDLLAAYVEHPELLDAVLGFRQRVKEQIQPNFQQNRFFHWFSQIGNFGNLRS